MAGAGEVNHLSKFQLPLVLLVGSEDIFTKDESLTDLLDDESVCQTVPAKPGLLITFTSFGKLLDF